MHLGLAAGASVWEISRLRLLNKRPMIWETSVIPKILAPDLAQQLSARNKPSLYDLLDEVYGLKESREEQTLMSRPASTREHELLDLMSFEWVVEVSGVSFSTRHQTIDAFRMVFVAKAFTFRLETAPSFFVQAVEVTDRPPGSSELDDGRVRMPQKTGHGPGGIRDASRRVRPWRRACAGPR